MKEGGRVQRNFIIPKRHEKAVFLSKPAFLIRFSEQGADASGQQYRKKRNLRRRNRLKKILSYALQTVRISTKRRKNCPDGKPVTRLPGAVKK